MGGESPAGRVMGWWGYGGVADGQGGSCRSEVDTRGWSGGRRDGEWGAEAGGCGVRAEGLCRRTLRLDGEFRRSVDGVGLGGGGVRFPVEGSKWGQVGGCGVAVGREVE